MPGGNRPEKQHVQPFDMGIEDVDLTSITTFDSTIFKLPLLAMGTLVITRTGGTAVGAADLQISQYDNTSPTPALVTGPTDFITGLDIQTTNTVIFLFGAGESAAIEGTGGLQNIANVLKIPYACRLRINVTTAADGTTTASLDMVLLD